MELGLKGRVAIVTGASQGLGRATALRLAQEGADLAIAARGAQALEAVAADIRALGVRVAVVQADVGVAADCQRLVQEAVQAFGKVDILVNNAGSSARGEFESVTDEDWQADFDTKFFAAIRLARLVLPHMKKNRWGRVVNITNVAAKQPGAQSMPTSVTRAAGLALTKALSREFAADNVLVNAVCIGFVRAQQHETKAAKLGVDIEPYYQSLAKAVPLGRVGRAEEVANVIAFLASEAASFVTGTSINIDGGQSGVL